MSSTAPDLALLSTASAPPPQALRLPELLAPAGDWECVRAAVENGADAIYFGLEKFNARMRAHNFTEADLPQLMTFLHRRGVKGYVTFNILAFENELADAEQYARAMIAAGVDAAIVQDVGICRMLRQLSPDFPIHASTQMTITSAGGVEFARQLGCDLVVLARECSLKEIAKIAAGDEGRATRAGEPAARPTDHQSSLPLEVFIHGALCVAYSGQCLTSEALGGRSANRGECAQACRMPYELIADGRMVPLGDRRYLLSPQDLAGLEVLPELVRLGVASLKIEGRLKSPEYVANITRIYRGALDQTPNTKDQTPNTKDQTPNTKGQTPNTKDQTPNTKHQTPNTKDQAPSTKGQAPNTKDEDPSADRYEMEMAFSRGLYTGWFRGTNNQQLVHGRFGKKRGVFLGDVTEVSRDGVVVALEAPLKPGDGVVFDAGKPEEKEEGGRVYELGRTAVSPGTRRFSWLNGKAERQHVWLKFGQGDVDFRRVQVGDKVWKTSDPALERRLRQSFEGGEPRLQRPIRFEVHGLAGQPLTVIARDEQGHVARRESAMPLARAEKQPLTADRLADQLGRLGGTPFKLGVVENHVEGEVMLPISELNRIRRDLVADLGTQREQPNRWTLREGEWAAPAPSPEGQKRAVVPQLRVLVRNLSQLESVLESGVETVYCEFEDPKKYRGAVARFRLFHGADPSRSNDDGAEGPTIWVAPPRIFKMGEEWTLKQVRSSEADGYLVRNYDHLSFFAGARRIGDYSLNIANRLAAEYFKNEFGLERVTASYDLNFGQLEALLRAAPPEWFEVTIHQHMPMFHMEHCVFCAFLSQGTDYTNCGRPCDRNDLKLRDRVGAEHPVKADAGCRNTVFNALAQTGAEYVPALIRLGVRHFRLEFLNETPEQVAGTLGKYRQLLDGRITGAQLWRELKLFNQLGVTRGQMGR